MSIIPVTLGGTARLSLVLEDGTVTQFPQANVYESGNASPLIAVNLAHFAEGLYEVDYTPPALGAFNVVYTVYEDSSRLIPNPLYSKELDQLLVQRDALGVLDSLVERIIRLLGLVRENAFIDNTVWDDCDQMISARFRIFDSAAATNAATDGGSESAIETYQITAEYEAAGRMKSYRMVKL